jgi:hypothetical protein
MMSRKSVSIVLSATALLTLCACGFEPVMEDAKYWQRSNVSEATYMEGPKAQQMLQRDIARCVTDLRERELLYALRNSTPGDVTYEDGRVPDPSTPPGQLEQWETPARNGALYAEHSDYHDFESCMVAKGWERVEYLPYDVAKKSRETYTESILRQQYRSKSDVPPEPPPGNNQGDSVTGNLNE